MIHRGLERGAVGAAFKKKAVGTVAQSDEEPVQGRLFERPVSRGAFENGDKLAEARVEFKVAKVADGHDTALRVAARLVRQYLFHADEVKIGPDLLRSHGGSFNGDR